MSIFQEINDLSNPDKIEEALLENIQELEEFVDTSEMSLERLEKGFDAARRGLSLAHKLPKEQQIKHFSRILTNMNKLRGGLARMIKSMENEDTPTDDVEAAGSQLKSQHPLTQFARFRDREVA